MPTTADNKPNPPAKYEKPVILDQYFIKDMTPLELQEHNEEVRKKSAYRPLSYVLLSQLDKKIIVVMAIYGKEVLTVYSKKDGATKVKVNLRDLEHYVCPRVSLEDESKDPSPQMLYQYLDRLFNLHMFFVSAQDGLVAATNLAEAITNEARMKLNP